MDYLQPDFYRFNEDSLKLVRFIAQHQSNARFLLDAGAGCGVIGIELARQMEIEEVHFLEVQQDFSSYLEKNLELYLTGKKYFISINSFSQYQADRRFDLIVCNPPYYLPGRGQPNKDIKKGICRSFQIDSWAALLNLFKNHLSIDGTAWVVIKNDNNLLKVVEREMEVSALVMEVMTLDDLFILKFTLPTEYKY